MKTVFAMAVLGVFGSAVLCTAVQVKVAGALPDVFVSVLAEVKAKTRLPVLLPTELPTPFSKAKEATVDKATADEYAVNLYYESDVGNPFFAAGFAAQNNHHYSPRELSNVRAVKLADRMVGYFRPVSCGGSCAPANIWWERGRALYQIQLMLGPSLSERKQQRIITTVANSAIAAGPR